MIMDMIVTASDKFTSSDIGLAVRPDVTYDEWFAYGQRLSRAYSKLQFLIGDWLNAGEALFGEKYAQSLDDKLYAYGTLRNYASICARIPYENRSTKLTFHQTKHVACLEPHEQKAIIEAAAKAKHITGDEILEAVHKVMGKTDHETRESAEGTIHGYGEYLTYNTVTIVIDKADMGWILHCNKVVIRPK